MYVVKLSVRGRDLQALHEFVEELRRNCETHARINPVSGVLSLDRCLIKVKLGTVPEELTFIRRFEMGAQLDVELLCEDPRSAVNVVNLVVQICRARSLGVELV